MKRISFLIVVHRPIYEHNRIFAKILIIDYVFDIK